MLSPTVIIAAGLVLALLLLIVTVSVVSIVSVASKVADQRKDGIKVLGQLGTMLRHILDTIRRRRGGGGDPTA
jgi:hypothetical protein